MTKLKDYGILVVEAKKAGKQATQRACKKAEKKMKNEKKVLYEYDTDWHGHCDGGRSQYIVYIASDKLYVRREQDSRWIGSMTDTVYVYDMTGTVLHAMIHMIHMIDTDMTCIDTYTVTDDELQEQLECRDWGTLRADYTYDSRCIHCLRRGHKLQ